MAIDKGYRRKGSFIMRFSEITESPAYRDLGTVARCLLEEFQFIYRNGRNGKLSISTRKASELLNVSEPTAQKAFHELADHGFIILTKGQLWQERKAREWLLTFEPGNNGREPTDDWKHWDASQKKSPTKKTGAVRSKKQWQNAGKGGGWDESSYLQ